MVVDHLLSDKTWFSRLSVDEKIKVRNERPTPTLTLSPEKKCQIYAKISAKLVFNSSMADREFRKKQALLFSMLVIFE